MKGCSKFREQLSSYIDGELGADESRQLEAHLHACAQCSGALEEIRKTVAHLNGLEQIEPPPWLAQKVMARVKEERIAEERKGFFSKLFSLRPLYVKAPLGALATGMIAFTIYYYFQTVIPEIQNRQSEQSHEISDHTTQAGKSIEPEASPKKSSAGKKSDPGIREKTAASEKPRVEEYKIQALPREDARDASNSDMPASAPAPYMDTRHAEKQRSFKSMEYDSAKEQDNVAVRKSLKGGSATASSGSTGRPLAQKIPAIFHVETEDPAAAGRQVAGIVTKLGGRNIGSDLAGTKTILKAELNSARLREFFDELKKIGPLKEKIAPAFADAENIAITIEVSPFGPQPADAGTE